MTRDQFITKLLHERDKFELLLNRIGFTRRMTMKGVSGNWSIKDIIAHIWAYEQFIADRLNEITHDEAYTPCKTQNALDAFLDQFGYPDFGSPLMDDKISDAWVFEKYRNISLEELVAQELQAFNSIVSALETMPEDLIKRHNIFDRVAENTYQHYREHIKEIRIWLRSHAINPKKS